MSSSGISATTTDWQIALPEARAKLLLSLSLDLFLFLAGAVALYPRCLLREITAKAAPAKKVETSHKPQKADLFI